MNMFLGSSAKTPTDYINELDEPRRSEIKHLHDVICKAVPDFKPSMVSGMIGYGSYHYKSASGREGDWPIIALSSRKNYISLYVCAGDGKRYMAEIYHNRLPKTNIGKSCIRFKHLSDVDLDVITEMLQRAPGMVQF